MSTKKVIIVLIAIVGLSILVCGGVGLLIYTYLVPTQISSSSDGSAEVVEEVPATLEPEAILGENIRATPSSYQPAAGICGSSEGDYAVVEIFPDMPSPRCVIAFPNQKLKVINRTNTAFTASLGDKQITIQAGEEGSIEAALGSYLLPGVHDVSTSAYFGPEVWLKEE